MAKISERVGEERPLRYAMIGGVTLCGDDENPVGRIISVSSIMSCCALPHNLLIFEIGGNPIQIELSPDSMRKLANDMLANVDAMTGGEFG